MTSPITLRTKVALALDPRLRPESGLSRINKLIIACILLSLLVAVISTEEPVYQDHKTLFLYTEWVLGLIFGVEYLARVWTSIENPLHSSRLHYIFKPAPLLDLFTVLLTFATFFGAEGFLLRLVRVLRILRLARLGEFSDATHLISQAISKRRFELLLSAGIALLLLTVSSSALYLIEGGVQPEAFGSIPRAMWWSVATLTTVGYGDVYPVTAAGRLLAAFTAIAGIGLIAMPTGILAAAFSDAMQDARKAKQAELDALKAEIQTKAADQHTD
ncbi:MAG: ion transporter [Pseudomonadota bacterium]|nr:ion transporter [Pseudomonadota bacterium]